MQNSFEQLFQLIIKHDYFINSNPRGTIELGSTVLNESKNIRLRQNGNGFHAFRLTNSVTQSSSSDEFLSLYFPIKFNDSYFFNYTELKFSKQTVSFFSTEQEVNGLIKSDDSTHIELQPSNFTMELEQGSLSSISIKLPDGKIKELPLQMAPAQNGYLIDLTNELDGKYELYFDFKDQEENISYVFFLSDNFYRTPPSGIFECKLNLDKIESNVNIPTYTISFQNRSSYWRYLIININDEEWGTSQINSVIINNNNIEFLKQKEQIHLPNGKLAYCFISSKPIPLMERPPWQLKLTTKNNPSGIILPYPSVKNIHEIPSEDESTQEDPENFISDMYVFV